MDLMDELTLRWLDGGLSLEEERRLFELCAADPQADARHLSLLRVEAALRGLGKPPEIVPGTLAELRQAGTDDLERSVMRTIAHLPQPAWSAGTMPPARWRPVRWIAALALSLVVAAIWWRGSSESSGRLDLPTLASFTERVEIVDELGQTRPAAAQGLVQAGQTLIAHDDDYAVLAYPDGTRVELFGPSRMLVLEVPQGNKRLKLLAGSVQLDVRPQPAGLPMIVGTPQGDVRVLGTRFRLAAGDERTRIEMEEGKVAFDRHRDGRTVEVEKGAYVVADQSPEKVAVQPLPPTLVAPLWSRKKAGSALAMTADGSWLAVGQRSGGGVLVLDAQTGEQHADLAAVSIAEQSCWPADRLAFAQGNAHVVNLNARSQASYWDLASGEHLAIPLVGEAGALRAIGPEGRMLGVTLKGGWQPKLRLWRLSDQAEPELIRDAGGKNDMWAAAFSHDGARLAFGTRIGWVHVEQAETGEELWRQRVGESAIRQIALSPDERWLALYSPGLGIQVWSLEQDQLLASWLPEGPAARSLVFSPDSTQLAAGLADRTVRFWSIPDGRSTLLIETGRGGAEQIAFTADGRRLATAGQDVAMWELP